MKKIFIGSDISKLKLDVCLLVDDEIQDEAVLVNRESDIKSYLQGLLRHYQAEDILICAEYTGQYIYPLCCASAELGIDLWMENPVEIKYRSGMQRGKNDRIDARKIAIYACRFKDRCRLFLLPEQTIRVLKQLTSERDLYMADKSKYKGQLTDQKSYMDKEDYKRKSKRLKKLIKGLEQSISAVEDEMHDCIRSNPVLLRQYKLLCSVEGIGDKTAIKMIVVTNAFRDFKEGRKFCCHAGVAPFSYTSGSSQRSRNKVSHRADKSIKKLLHMAAMSVIKNPGELRDYYLRKVEEGKNKMLVINAVRAKLVLRMFAVIKNDQMYQKNYINPLV